MPFSRGAPIVGRRRRTSTRPSPANLEKFPTVGARPTIKLVPVKPVRRQTKAVKVTANAMIPPIPGLTALARRLTGRDISGTAPGRTTRALGEVGKTVSAYKPIRRRRRG